jgi:hypothetical protein
MPDKPEPPGDLGEQEVIRKAMSLLGKRGGPARAKKLTARQRSEIARKAGRAGGRGRPKAR